MMQSLAGNPTSITMICAWYKRNRINKEDSFNMLLELNNKIKQELEISQQEMGAEYDASSQIGLIKSNHIALDMTTKMNIELLTQRNQEDVQLLFFLSCLPDIRGSIFGLLKHLHYMYRERPLAPSITIYLPLTTFLVLLFK